MSKIVEYKKICFYRCCNAIILSIAVQYFLLATFLFIANINILHPIKWLSSTSDVLFSFSTYFSFMLLAVANATFGMILGKSYLEVRKYYPNRIKRLINTSFRKFIVLGSLIFISSITAWLYTKFLKASYKESSSSSCHELDCLNYRCTFMIYGGIFAGIYYFLIRFLRAEYELFFPVVQQQKWIKIRSVVYSSLYSSFAESVFPTLCYIIVFWMFGGLLNDYFSQIFAFEENESHVSLISLGRNFHMLLYVWLLCSQILSNVKLMQQFFSILLLEEIHFPIKPKFMGMEDETEIALFEAITMSQIPVIQILATNELYSISTERSPKRRQEIFSLSIPGGHPYNWHQLSKKCLSVITTFTSDIKLSMANDSSNSIQDLKPNPYMMDKIRLRQCNETHGIRHMASETVYINQPSTGAQNKPSTSQRINDQCEQMARLFENSFFSVLYSIPGFFYLFGEPNGGKTVFLLSNSQHIILLVQSLSGICTASLAEDKFGVVQSALSDIIGALLQLLKEVNKLNNVNLNGKKVDKNLIALKGAVKRSLFKICTVFGNYLRDLISDPTDLRFLQNFISYHET